MKFEEPGTHPSGSERFRIVTWFAESDGEPKAEPARRNGKHGVSSVSPSTGPCLCGSGEREPLTVERIAALRQWLAAGGHNTPEVAEEVARRMLASGEL